MSRILAIDQGTTSTRALVASLDGELHVTASRGHSTSYPRPGWVEQDAKELLSNINLCMASAAGVDAIGVANQGESCLAWDAITGEPLSPVIGWQDSRTSSAMAELEASGEGARVRQIAGLPVDSYFSASKLAWLFKNIPAVADAFSRGRLRLGTTDSYFLDRLTGRFVTDLATASRTSLLDIRTGRWDGELCGIFGVPIGCLPEIVRNCGDFGSIGGIPVTASIVDQQAALYGHGCRAPGDTKMTFGTGAFALSLCTGLPGDRDLAGLFPTVAWDLGQGPIYALEGGVYDAGAAVDWAIRAGMAEDLASLETYAGGPAIDRNLVFVPAFSGLGSPFWDRSAAPLVIGLGPETTRTEINQSLLEGIAMLAANVLMSIDAAHPIAGSVSVDGGMTTNPYFAQFLADCTGRSIVRRASTEMTAFGVAALAARSLGIELPQPGHKGSPLLPAEVPRHVWHHRFAEAVAKSKGWTRSRSTADV